ncbi:MAG: hypothetical protein IH623_19145, partial [Verrucomicrobia bacterium]|nr:hypothetical protein [Verrucomicrobiota bacterium]
MKTQSSLNPRCGRLCCYVLASMLLAAVTHAYALDNWTTNQVSTNWFGLSHVVYGNGRYVAAGGRSDGGAILSSDDGLNWTLRADGGCCGPPSLVWGLTYSEGRFVAVGHFGGTAISTNGVDWTFGRAASAGLTGVAVADGICVAVGDGTVGNTVDSIFKSTNGIDWVAEAKSTNEIRDVWDVANRGSRFVAVAAGGYAY